MKETILVSGATGMLGAHLLYQITADGLRVRALYRHSSRKDRVRKIFSYYCDEPEKLLARVNWVEADLLDVVALEEAMVGIREIYHCAAKVSFDPKDVRDIVETNRQMTANMVNIALEQNIGKLVHVSSVAALGRTSRKGEINENNTWVEGRQNSVYAKSKYLSELEVWRGMEEGLNAVIVNPTIILGPGNWDGGSAAMFGTIAKGFRFYTHGINGYVDVRDVASVMLRLMAADIHSERFLLVSENKTYKEVFDKMADALNVKRPAIEAKRWMGNIVWRMERLRTVLFGGNPMVTKETARTSHQQNFYSNKKIRERMGFSFRKVDESIEDFAVFYKKDKG